MICTTTKVICTTPLSCHGGLFSLKQMFAKLVQYLADDVMVIRCDGCATLVGFKGYVNKPMKLMKVNIDEEATEVDSVICQIC